MESIFQHVVKILFALEKANIIITLPECEFFTQKFLYLAHIIDSGTLSIYDTTFKLLEKENMHRKHHYLSSFLGFCNTYGPFVHGYKNIRSPINFLLPE